MFGLRKETGKCVNISKGAKGLGKLESGVGAWLFTTCIGHDERHEVVTGCVALELKESADKNVLFDAVKLGNPG